jgi:hypothetical protein
MINFLNKISGLRIWQTLLFFISIFLSGYGIGNDNLKIATIGIIIYGIVFLFALFSFLKPRGKKADG